MTSNQGLRTPKNRVMALHQNKSSMLYENCYDHKSGGALIFPLEIQRVDREMNSKSAMKRNRPYDQEDFMFNNQVIAISSKMKDEKPLAEVTVDQHSLNVVVQNNFECGATPTIS